MSVSIVELLQEAKKQERGPFYQCDCYHYGSVEAFCKECGKPSVMKEGQVYLVIGASWNYHHEKHKIPILDFVSQVLVLVEEANKDGKH